MDLFELAKNILEKEYLITKLRSKKIDAEIKAWKTIDFDGEGLKLAKQKEIRVQQEISAEISELRNAITDAEYAGRLYNIILQQGTG